MNMGQSTSVDGSSPVPNTLGYLQEVVRHTRFLTEIAGLSYEEFQQNLNDLNKLTRQCVSADGKQLLFAVKKGTDASVLWKGTVRVACVKVDPGTRAVESFRLLSLREFLRVSKTLRSQLLAAAQGAEDRPPAFSVSALLREMELGEDSDLDRLSECCICLERRPEVMLPCAHSYCLPCIEQWKVNNSTCPLCRGYLDSDEAWVISEAPGAHEVSSELSESLMALASEPKPPS
ncbi:RING finger protein 141-like [Bacillus rossius redtenbacheri]|uniref:RING finger protein 141-like n=1 Tax=Bacillus rossius redtenbacheri TaxID=93214 RepID=UPI002FDD27BC